AGVDPVLEAGGDDGGSEENVDEDVVELGEKAGESGAAAGFGEAVGAEFLLASGDLAGGEAGFGIDVEDAEGFGGVEGMPRAGIEVVGLAGNAVIGHRSG